MFSPPRPDSFTNGILLGLVLAMLASPFVLGQDHKKGAEIYTTYCAQCHGSNLEGGQFSGFLDGMWNFFGGQVRIFL